MPHFSSIAAPELGYALAALALVAVIAYFLSAALALQVFRPQSVVVARYETPKSASPGVAAWLLERGALPRAVAAAVANMAAKGYVQIEQRGDSYSITQLGPDVSLDLEPEEDALARTLFSSCTSLQDALTDTSPSTGSSFDFDEASPRLQAALDAFSWALADTGYLSRHILLSVPAWVISGVGAATAIVQGDLLDHLGRGTTELLVIAFACFIVAVRTLPETLEKISAWLPASTAPKRPWSSADNMTFTLFMAGLGGIALLALLSSTLTALIVAAFLGVNAVFFHMLQGPTAAGKKALAELAGYRKFLAEVDADTISRMNSCEAVPTQLTQKQAYAIAFHLDLGWGEQFVGCVSDLVERSEVFSRIFKPRDAET